MKSPMLCSSAPTGAEGLPTFPSNPEDWVMERKVDGWRFLFENLSYGPMWTGGRNGLTYASPSLEEIERVLKHVPRGTMLDGEIVAVTHDGVELKSPAVSTILADPRKGRLIYVVFDILRVGDVDVTSLSLEQRKRLLGAVPLRNNLYDTRVFPMLGQPLDWDTYQSWLDEGGEGCVVKKKSSLYRFDKRSKEWLKLKPQQTCDAIVTRIIGGKGEHNRNLPGSFEIKLCDNLVETSVKIPDDKLVASVHRDPEGWIGARIEIRHHGLFPDGKPRHPVMVRTREDM